MTEATTSMNTITYANQILLDYLAYDDTMDAASHLNNHFIIEFNNRMDAIYVAGQPITQDMLTSIHIDLEDEDDKEAHDEYEYYEEYYYEFIMDRTPEPLVDDDYLDVEVDIDMTSVYALINTAPMMVTAPAA
jgi:hypothetical protein